LKGVDLKPVGPLKKKFGDGKRGVGKRKKQRSDKRNYWEEDRVSKLQEGVGKTSVCAEHLVARKTVRSVLFEKRDPVGENKNLETETQGVDNGVYDESSSEMQLLPVRKRFRSEQRGDKR